MNRTLRILTALLVAQVLIGIYVYWPRAIAETGGLLFAGRTETAISRLVIQDDKALQLILEDKGGTWVLPDAGDFPADATKIAPLIENIKQLKTGRLITQTAASHRQLLVAEDKYTRRLDIQWQDGARSLIFIGTSSGAGATHFRLDPQPEVYLSADLTSYGITPQASNFIDTSFVSIPAETVTALVLENAAGKLEFEKAGDAWSLKGMGADELFNSSAFTSVLTQATGLRMSAPLGKEKKPTYGLAQPKATVQIMASKDNAAQEFTLQVGAKVGEDYAMSFSGSPYVVRVSSYSALNFTEKTRADFITPPTTPTPAAAP